MRLGKKNLLYSMALAGVMLLFLVGYFMYMLPSLYVDYMMEQNLKSIRLQHQTYMEQGSYEGIRVKNSTACISVEFPREGDFFLVTGKAFSARFQIRDERLRRILDSCRERLFEARGDLQTGEALDLEEELRQLGEIFQESVAEEQKLPVSVEWSSLPYETEYRNESVKIHTYSGGLCIYETGVEDFSNRYTNYIAFEKTGERLVLSLLPVVSPDVDEIRPVVLQSLPMLGAVILLLVLLFSQMYSRGIVRPILELVLHTERMRYTKDFSVERFSQGESSGGDEVQELADTIDDLYQQIRESYRQLEEKNRELAEENERQEIFLRASSHQLKTPIAAALLLVDGMMNEVGRYRETRIYLPRVKEQLLSMRKIVEDILYLNHCAEDMRFQRIDIWKVLTEKLRSYQIALTDKRISVEMPREAKLLTETDEAMISQILDNLLSNAVRYTPGGGTIRIDLVQAGGKKGIRIENFGVTIPGELIPHIFEPFVSGSHDRDGSGEASHGLGLYIALYYARKLGFGLSVQNGEDSVITVICT